MSFSDRRPSHFFDPLVGKTTTFLLRGRQANIGFARTMMRLLAEAGAECSILDLDAFYSSNAGLVLAPLADGAESSTIRVPAPGSDIEDEFSRLFETAQEVIVIDSLNSLYHLTSVEDGSSRSRKLTFALAALSYLARTNAKAVVLSMYRREGFARPGPNRSISGLSDVTAAVDIRGSDLTIRTERGSAWPGGSFSTRAL